MNKSSPSFLMDLRLLVKLGELPLLTLHSILWSWLCNKESTYDAGDTGSIPGSGRAPGGGNGKPLQRSCWETPMTEELSSTGSQSRTRLSGRAQHVAFFDFMYLVLFLWHNVRMNKSPYPRPCILTTVVYQSLSITCVTQSCLTLCDPMSCMYVARQAPLPMGIPKQECWSRLPFPSPEDLPDLGIKPRYPALQAYSFSYELQGSSAIPYPEVKIKLLRLLNN